MPPEGSAVPLLAGEEQWGRVSTSLEQGGAAAGDGAGAAYAGGRRSSAPLGSLSPPEGPQKVTPKGDVAAVTGTVLTDQDFSFPS